MSTLQMKFKRCTFKAVDGGPAAVELQLVLVDAVDVTELAAYVGQNVNVDIWSPQQRLFDEVASVVENGHVEPISAGRRRRGTRADPTSEE